MRIVVIIQNWEEHERGWGVRPDGFTVHTSLAQRDAYVDAYNRKFNSKAVVPDDYTCVSGAPFLADVDAELCARIEKATKRRIVAEGRTVNGIWGRGNFFSGKQQLTAADITWPEDCD